MFIAMRTTKYIKAPEGRHVAASYGRRETGKRKGGIHSGWIPQPIGQGNPAPTMAGIIPKRESGFRISVYPKGLKASAKNGII